MHAHGLLQPLATYKVKFYNGRQEPARWLTVFLVLLFIPLFISTVRADDWKVDIFTNPGSYGLDATGNSYVDGYWYMYKYDTNGAPVWQKSWSSLLAGVTNGNNTPFRWSVFCRNGSFFTIVQLQDANWEFAGVRMAGFDADGNQTTFPATTLPDNFIMAAPFSIDTNNTSNGVVAVSENQVTGLDVDGITYNVTYTPSVSLTRYKGDGTAVFSGATISAADLGRSDGDIEIQGLEVSADQSIIYLAGTLKDPIHLWTSRYPDNIFVARINAADGSMAWSRRVGPDLWPSSGDYWVPFEVTSLAVGVDNRAHVTAKDWLYTPSFITRKNIYLRVTAANALEVQEEPSSIGSERLAAGEDGFLYGYGIGSAADRSGDTGLGDTGGYLVKYDPSGQSLDMLLVAPVGRTNDSQPFGARIDAVGNNYVWGYTFSAGPAFVQKNALLVPILAVNGTDANNTDINVITGPDVDPDSLTDRTAMEFTLHNKTGANATISALTFSSKGKGDENQTFTNIRIVDDVGDVVAGPSSYDGNHQLQFTPNRDIAANETNTWKLVYDISQDTCACIGGKYFTAELTSATAQDDAGEPVDISGLQSPVTGLKITIPEGDLSIDPVTNNQSADKENPLPKKLAALVNNQSVGAGCGPVVFDIETQPDHGALLSIFKVETTAMTGNRAESAFTLGTAVGDYEIKAYLDNPTCIVHPYDGGTGTGGQITLHSGLKVSSDAKTVIFTAKALGVEAYGAQHNGKTSLNDIGTFIQNIPANNVFKAKVEPKDGFSKVEFRLAGKNEQSTASNGIFTSNTFDMKDLSAGNNTLTIAAYTTQKEYQDTATVSAIAFPAWVSPLTSLTSGISTQFLEDQEKYKLSFSYPMDFAWSKAVDTVILLLGGAKNDSNLSFNANAYYNINRTSSFDAAGDLAAKILGHDFTVNGNLSGSFDADFDFLGGKGDLKMTLPFTLPSKGASKTVLVYGVPVTLAVDISGDGNVYLTGKAQLGGNLEFKKILIIPAVDVTLDANASVAAFFGAAKLGVNARPLTELELRLLYLSGAGIDPTFGGRITVPLRVIGSLFWGLASGTLASTTLGPYGFGSMASRQASALRQTTDFEDGFQSPEFISTSAIAAGPDGKFLLIFTSDTDPATGSVDPDVYYRLYDGSAWAGSNSLAREADKWELDPAVTYIDNGRALALWTANDGTKTLDDLNDIFAAQDIRFSVWDGTSWSSPADIIDDNETDGVADVSYDPVTNQAVAVWFHDANSDHDVETRRQWEIHSSIFDAGDDTWSIPENISGSDTAADYLPAVAAANGKTMAVWLRDTDGVFLTTMDSIADGTNVDYSNTDAAVYYCLHDTNGWSTPAAVPGSDSDSGFLVSTAVAVNDDAAGAVVFWAGKTNGDAAGTSKTSLRYSIYSFGDQTWSTPVAIPSSGSVEDLRAFIDTNDLATVLWTGTSFGHNNIRTATVDLKKTALKQTTSAHTTLASPQAAYTPVTPVTNDAGDTVWGLDAAMDSTGKLMAVFRRDNFYSPSDLSGDGMSDNLTAGEVNPDSGDLTGNITEAPIDANSDELYEMLRVTIEADIHMAGDYKVTASLNDINGNRIAELSAADQNINAGTHTFTLDIPGGFISAHGVDGPYTITDVILFNNSGIVVATDTSGFDTAAYAAADFTDGPLLLDRDLYIGTDDTVVVSVTDPLKNTDSAIQDSLSVLVSSDTDPTGLQMTLTETGDNSGVFTGTLHFSLTATENDTIHVGHHGVVTAVYKTNNPAFTWQKMASWIGCLPENDMDDDGTCDDVDGCPADPGKIDPGVCGCATSDTDRDGDLIEDCLDNFPDDPIMPGDVNNDSLRDLTDVILAIRTASGMGDSPIFKQADVNNDGAIGLPEAVYVFRLIGE
ncbi:MAG: hypothetical protein GXP53_03370 [Deltaproteobacteria bacterium]|nr:hypothetical protein [Deltaproteobacteria bacterium]